jgi:hypothetical protein
VLTCQHHIQWVREVEGGLHQCILCTQVVTKKDVIPKLEDLPEEFARRWDAHEATRAAASQVSAAPAATATSTPTATVTPIAPPTSTPTPSAPPLLDPAASHA